MGECIERSAAIKAAKHAWAKGLEPSQYIEALPAVDAVIVTRCGDCKYRIYKHVNDWIGEIGGCSIFNHPMPNDAFCSYGERKDGGDG